MKDRRRLTRVILLGVACLSVPLCCLPVCAIVPTYPMFWARFTVLNESDQVLYVTPIGERSGQRRIFLDQVSKFPYAPLLKRADVRLEPGEPVQIYCRGFDEPPWTLAAIAVRDERGETRQLLVDEPALALMWASPERTYRIGSLSELERATPEVAELAEKAGRLNVVAWLMIAAGGIPIGLFSAWLSRVRKDRKE